jgi:plastocyanin
VDKIREHRRLIALMAILALAAAACGGGSASSATQPAVASTGAARAVSDVLQVAAKDFSFSLNLTSLHPGQPGVNVIFNNNGTTPHTLTFYSDAGYKTKIPGDADSGPVTAGDTAIFAFVVPDGVTTVYYRCDIHPTKMTGQLPVQ